MGVLCLVFASDVVQENKAAKQCQLLLHLHFTVVALEQEHQLLDFSCVLNFVVEGVVVSAIFSRKPVQI